MIKKKFKFTADVSGIDLDAVDFLDNATNVYRTEEFIVKQCVSYITDAGGRTRLMSEDTYYCRTAVRDDLYNELFLTEGRRIRSSMYTRVYIE